jgi:hypothetical protein
MTSCRPDPVEFSAVRIVGAATLTMETSRMAMNWPVRMTVSSQALERRTTGRSMDTAVMRSRVARYRYQ